MYWDQWDLAAIIVVVMTVEKFVRDDRWFSLANNNQFISNVCPEYSIAVSNVTMRRFSFSNEYTWIPFFQFAPFQFTNKLSVSCATNDTIMRAWALTCCISSRDNHLKDDKAIGQTKTLPQNSQPADGGGNMAPQN